MNGFSEGKARYLIYNQQVAIKTHGLSSVSTADNDQLINYTFNPFTICQRAHAPSNLSSSVAHAIDVQVSLYGQLKGGLMVINQIIDLVQEQIETL